MGWNAIKRKYSAIRRMSYKNIVNLRVLSPRNRIMIMNLNRNMSHIAQIGLKSLALSSLVSIVLFSSCKNDSRNFTETERRAEKLTELCDSLDAIASSVRGEVGIAVIIDSSDTVTVNNEDVYPLMSVFKLHQAIAVCHEFDRRGTSLDSLVYIDRSSLNADTWSPMLKDYLTAHFHMPVSELLRYALVKSDNNASNMMFDRLVSVAATDSFVATLIPRDQFRLSFREADMQSDHSLSYANHSSPLAAAILVERLFTDGIVSPAKQGFIRDAMRECVTGIDRISAPLRDKEGVKVAHKTGSGFTNERGQLIAHNDAAYVELPDGRHYTIVVFVKDFYGDERGASTVISRISATTYEYINGLTDSGTK